jgi:putative peptide zinc metalloprotease protein
MNTDIIPKLSDQITFHPLNKTEYFIHQTEHDHRIKISSELYNFVKLIDKQKNITNLVSEFNLKYKSNLTSEFAYDFLYSKLATFGIIESEVVKVRKSEKPSYIKLNFIVINERTISKFTKYLHHLFYPKTLKTILVLSIIILSTCFYFLNHEIFYTSIPKSEWLYFFILSFIGVTFHEFGHASAAHHFGAKHGGIGGGFYLFMPVYFADVTDIWKLPKQQRIIVNLAGMYFEMIYSVFLITMGIVFCKPFLIILSSIYSISILHNLNPFARSDGYWILSDAIEKPNLMMHGFLKIKQIFKSKINWKKLDWFILLYGIISYCFILFFIYLVVIKNPNSILYFPQNLTHFIQNLFYENSQFSLVELSKLIIPILFFYLIFGFIKGFIPLLKHKTKNTLNKLVQRNKTAK